MDNVLPVEEPKKEENKVLQFEGRYKGTDLILAATALRDNAHGEKEIEPGWFTIIFIGREAIREIGKKLVDMKDGEEFMLYVQNPDMPKGSV